jgi:hypothetical protein
VFELAKQTSGFIEPLVALEALQDFSHIRSPTTRPSTPRFLSSHSAWGVGLLRMKSIQTLHALNAR